MDRIFEAVAISDAIDPQDIVVPTRQGYEVADHRDGYMYNVVLRSRLMIDDGNSEEPRTPSEYISDLNNLRREKDRLPKDELMTLASGLLTAITVRLQTYKPILFKGFEGDERERIQEWFWRTPDKFYEDGEQYAGELFMAREDFDRTKVGSTRVRFVDAKYNIETIEETEGGEPVSIITDLEDHILSTMPVRPIWLDEYIRGFVKTYDAILVAERDEQEAATA